MQSFNKHTNNDEDEDEDEDDSQDIEEVVDQKQGLEDKNSDESDDSDEHQSQMTASDEETSWIQWFVNIRGNDFYCEVDEPFVQDDFNLTGLSTVVPYYDYALDIILDIDIPLDALNEEQHDMVETAAEVLYGLIHARYILTTAGMSKMFQKYQNVNFGRCPRSLCQGQPVLPVGLSDMAREYSVEVFCPKCQETYHPRSSKHANLDGAYFGTTFCHLFLLTHTEFIIPPAVERYIPRIFGFRINDSSLYYRLRDINIVPTTQPQQQQQQPQSQHQQSQPQHQHQSLQQQQLLQSQSPSQKRKSPPRNNTITSNVNSGSNNNRNTDNNRIAW